jgi:hypothetical protein
MFQKKANTGLHPLLFGIENTPMKEETDDETTHEPVNYQDAPPSLQLQARAISLLLAYQWPSVRKRSRCAQKILRSDHLHFRR